MKSGLHEKMYHYETNTFCYVWKSKIRITDSYEFIRHMHECQFNFVYLYCFIKQGQDKQKQQHKQWEQTMNNEYFQCGDFYMH